MQTSRHTDKHEPELLAYLPCSLPSSASSISSQTPSRPCILCLVGSRMDISEDTNKMDFGRQPTTKEWFTTRSNDGLP